MSDLERLPGYDHWKTTPDEPEVGGCDVCGCDPVVLYQSDGVYYCDQCVATRAADLLFDCEPVKQAWAIATLEDRIHEAKKDLEYNRKFQERKRAAK